MPDLTHCHEYNAAKATASTGLACGTCARRTNSRTRGKWSCFVNDSGTSARGGNYGNGKLLPYLFLIGISKYAADSSRRLVDPILAHARPSPLRDPRRNLTQRNQPCGARHLSKVRPRWGGHKILVPCHPFQWPPLLSAGTRSSTIKTLPGYVTCNPL